MSRRAAPILKDVVPYCKYDRRVKPTRTASTVTVVSHNHLTTGTRNVILPKPRPNSARFFTWHNQSGKCHYCGDLTPMEKWTLDHKIPKSKGGCGPANKVGSCWTCNHAKGSMEYAKFMASPYLKRKRKYVLCQSLNL